VHYYLLEHDITIGLVLYDVSTALEDIEALLGDVEAAAIAMHAAVAMDDITYGIVLCSNRRCGIRATLYILK
jgi:hypothetical protein